MSTNKEITTGATQWKLMKAPKQHWSGIPQYDNTYKGIAPPLDSKTKRPKSGIPAEDAKRLEGLLQLSPGELGPRSEFWKDFEIKIGAKILRFDTTDPEDELQFIYLKNHHQVAFGHSDLKKNARALYVLYNDVDEAQHVVKKGNVKKDAYKAFIDMSTPEMIDTLMVMGKQIVSHEPSIIEAMMGRVVEREAAAFLAIAGDKNFKMKLFILKCVHYDILTKSRGRTIEEAAISFNGDHLGEGIDQVVATLNSKVNGAVYVALQKRLEVAMSAGTLSNSPLLSGNEIEALVIAPKPKKRVVTSNAASGKKKGQNIADSAGAVTTVTSPGNDSGDFLETADEIS